MARFYRDVAVDNAGDAGNVVTTSPARLRHLSIHNDNATAVAFVHLYDNGDYTEVTPGTTTPSATIPVEAGTTIDWTPNVMSQRGWMICASDAAAGSGSAVATVTVAAVYG